MAISSEKKKEVIEKVKNAVVKSKSLVFVNFKGLTVSSANELRRALESAGVKYYVAKKKLVKLALGKSKIEGGEPEFPGELAIAYGDDLVTPARGVHDFGKKIPGVLTILGGIFGGKFMNKEEMMEIASIPALPVLHGKFVNVINSPIQGFVIALSKIAERKS